ncbi:MAG: hypothetical protein E7472_00920 [Ruminococcaceae bacterium]|nr:hypothetical protein [Oscillospiraceae bacterium]
MFAEDERRTVLPQVRTRAVLPGGLAPGFAGLAAGGEHPQRFMPHFAVFSSKYTLYDARCEYYAPVNEYNSIKMQKQNGNCEYLYLTFCKNDI